ncbi:MAG: carboxypeptidase regulatory-like domain-containing protein [Bacteroidales bacterium]
MKKKYLFIVLSIISISLFSCKSDDPIVITGGITGIVTNKITNEPISGVNLTLSPGGLSKTSGDDGRYEFQDIEARQYDVQAQTSGYRYNVRSTIVVAGQTAKCDIILEPNN